MGFAMVAGGKPDMAAPVTGILLSDIAEGSIVKLNENGSPVEFYVAKHNYESGLNGAGRTLLVRKNAHSTRQWHSSNVNAYATSDIDAWLNSNYKELFTSSEKTAMQTTKFYYTPGNGNNVSAILQRTVFLLSWTELGMKAPGFTNADGSALSINIRNDVASQWTRSPYVGTTNSVLLLLTHGSGSKVPTDSEGIRPCFTIPSTAKFDPETLIFKGV